MRAQLDFPDAAARELVRVALQEDLGPQHLDVTTAATVGDGLAASAAVVARGDGVVAGMPVAELVLDAVAGLVALEPPRVDVLVADADRVRRGDVLARLHGSARVLLMGERTLLNILSRLSGVATHTRQWVDALDGTQARVLDTRKTTPGMRLLEKYAVRAGGGVNKRVGLFDVAMIKDNHKLAAGSIGAAYRAVRSRFPDVAIEVEATTLAEALEAYAAGARFVMCDNMALDVLAATVTALRAQAEPVEIEATGGLTLELARDVAKTGVDYLSVGALTHSSPVLDIALDLLATDR
ncbi:MAG: carboxylating nicotinate-nucleotide diphosphorylase [Dermatophilaceae bacterium]